MVTSLNRQPTSLADSKNVRRPEDWVEAPPISMASRRREILQSPGTRPLQPKANARISQVLKHGQGYIFEQGASVERKNIQSFDASFDALSCLTAAQHLLLPVMSSSWWRPLAYSPHCSFDPSMCESLYSKGLPGYDPFCPTIRH